jgi:hypothetical protein
MSVEVERLVCCQAHANRSLKLNLVIVNIDYILDNLDGWLPLASGGRLFNVSHNDCVCLHCYW